MDANLCAQVLVIENRRFPLILLCSANLILYIFTITNTQTDKLGFAWIFLMVMIEKYTSLTAAKLINFKL